MNKRVEKRKKSQKILGKFGYFRRGGANFAKNSNTQQI